MTSRPFSQPSATTLSVDDLVNHVRDGRVRIPEFQRLFRWQWEDVRRLFDSIVKGYPIGSLLLWQRPAPAESVRLGAIVVDSQAFTDGLWVVDGQQRLTSLANALDEEGAKDERFALAYDLKNEQFIRPSAGDDPYVIPLPILFDLKKLLRWFADHSEIGDRLDDASQVTKAIRQFSIPAYVVVQENEAILRDIFDRMNNYGKRLRRAEVFSALHPGARSLSAGSPLADIADAVESETRFGQIDDSTVLRAVLARRGGDVIREIRDEFDGNGDFGQESKDDMYREGTQAIQHAVQFLQRQVGVPHRAFLPYRFLLVVLTRFFAHFPSPEPRNLELLQRWFWRAAMIGPGIFSGASVAARVLATRIVAGDEVGSAQRLLEEPMTERYAQPELKKFKTSRADSRVALCAMWALRPRSPLTGKPYTIDDLVTAIPSGGTLTNIVERIVRREPTGQKGWAANCILHIEDEAAEATNEYFVTPAPGLDSETFAAVLASHALDAELAGNLARRDHVKFLDGRQRLLEQVVRVFLLRVAAPEFEDTPPLDSLDLDDEDGGVDEETD